MPSPSKKQTMSQERIVKELKKLEQCLEVDFSDRKTYILMLKYCFQLKFYNKAIKVLKKAVKEFPSENFFCVELAKLYLHVGQDKNAIATFEMSLAINKKDLSFEKDLINLYMKHSLYENLLKYSYKKKSIISFVLEEFKTKQTKQKEILTIFLSLLEKNPNKILFNLIAKVLSMQPRLLSTARKSLLLFIAQNSKNEKIFQEFYSLCQQDNSYSEGIDSFMGHLYKDATNVLYQKYLDLLLKKEKNYEKGIEIFSKLVYMHPHIVSFYLFLARYYLFLDKKEDALKTLKKGNKTVGNNDSLILFMGEIHIQDHKYEYTVKFCDQFYYNMDKPQRLKFLQYRALVGMNQIRKALNLYQQVLRDYPEEAKCYVGVYALACQLKDYRLAIDSMTFDQEKIESLMLLLEEDSSIKKPFLIYEHLICKFSDSEYVFRLLLKKAIESHYYQRYFLLVDHFLQNNPTDIVLLKEALEVAIKIDEDHRVVYFYKKIKYIDKNFSQNCQDSFLRMHCYVGAVEYASNLLIMEYHKIYKMALSSHKIYSAIEVLEKTLDIYPEDQLTMTYIIKHYKESQKKVELANIYAKLSLFFTTAEQYYEWAVLEKELGHVEKCLNILKKAIKKYPDDTAIALLLAEMLRKDEDIFFKSHLFYMKIQEKFPNEFQFSVYLGEIYSKGQDQKKALLFYEKALSLNSTLKDIYIVVINILKDMDALDRLLDLLERAIQYIPDEILFYMEIASVYSKKKQFARAIQVYKDALKIAPGDKNCYHKLFYLYCELEDFLSALRICSDNRDDFASLYQLSLKNSNHQIIIDILKKAVRLFSSDFEFHSNLAEWYYKTKNFVQAEKILSKIISLYPDHRASYVNLFHLLCQMNHLEVALDIYVKAYRIFPDDEEFPLKMASIHYKLGNYHKAIDNYKRVIKINHMHKSVFQKLGALYQKMNLSKEAFALYKEAISHFPYELYFYKKASTLLELNNNFNDAVRVLKKVLERYPKHIEFWQQLGRVYQKMSLVKESVNCFLKAIDLDKENKDLYLELAEVYFHFEKESEAIYLLKKILRLFPNYHVGYQKIFELYCSQQRYDYASEFFNELISLEEDSLESATIIPYIYLFKVYYVQKEYSQAIKFLESCLLKFPQNREILKKLAGVYYETGKVSEAIVYLKKSLSLLFEDKYVLKSLFNISFKSGQLKSAMKVYKQALILWPESKEEFASLYKLCSKSSSSAEKEAFDTVKEFLINSDDFTKTPISS